MREDADMIDIGRLQKLTAALAELCKDWYMTADNIFEVNFRHATCLIADQYGRA